MRNKVLDFFKYWSNVAFGSEFLMSYEIQYLEELNSAIKFVGNVEDAFTLNAPAKYKVD